MKRLFAILLALCFLCGCAEPDPGGTPDTNLVPLSDTATIAYPQTGKYQETALLANVPGQGWPQLLSIREDGTVDYIFSAEENLDADGRLSSDGLQYYTITPAGSYTRQETPWIEDLEDYLTRAWADAGVPGAFWHYRFTSKDGTIWILTQLEDPKADAKEPMLFSALFRVENGVMTMIPVDWRVDTGSEVLAIDRQLICGLRLEEDAILLELTWSIAAIDRYLTAVYAMNGELVELREQELYPIPQPDGSIDDDQTLYLLGSPWVWRRANAVTSDGVLYTWLQYFDQGILMQYTPNPSGKIEPEVLTVWSMDELDAVKAAVCQWNHTHASPIFRYETAESEDDLTRLNLELANGQGPDVLILDGLNISGYLDFMAPLDVDTTGVYENILESFTQGGDLLALPTRMNPWLLGRKATGTQGIGSLEDFADLITSSTGVLDLSFDFGNAYRYYDAMYDVTFREEVFDQWYPAWKDAFFPSGIFLSEVFVEFLEQTKRLCDHYSLDAFSASGLEERDFFIDSDASRYGNTGKRVFPYTLAATDHVGLYSYWPQSETGKDADPIPCIIDPIPGPDGVGVAVPKHIAAVRAGGSEKAGMEFIQIFLLDEMQMGGQFYDTGAADGYPVKWDVTERLLRIREEYLHREFQVNNNFRDTLENLHAVILEEYPYEVCLKAALDYYEGELTAQEAAQQVKEQTAMYLAEQN